MFHGCESSMSMSRSSVCGLFAPRNESAEERKVQIPKFSVVTMIDVTSTSQSQLFPTSCNTKIAMFVIGF